jgi:hypothetical protein
VDPENLKKVEKVKAEIAKGNIIRASMDGDASAAFIPGGGDASVEKNLKGLFSDAQTGNNDNMGVKSGAARDDDEGDTDDDNVLDTVPRTYEEIYEISNRNRKRNKEKKRQRDTEDDDAGGDNEGAAASSQSSVSASNTGRGGHSAASSVNANKMDTHMGERLFDESIYFSCAAAAGQGNLTDVDNTVRKKQRYSSPVPVLAISNNSLLI